MAKTKKAEVLTLEEKLQQALVPQEEQPYKVPDNWCWSRLETINLYKSVNIDPLKQENVLFELYSVPSSFNNYPEIIKGCEIGSIKQSVKKDDVLLCKINPRINRVWKVAQYTGNILIASSEWIVIRNHNINADYLLHCLRAPYFREYMLSNVSGVGGSLMRAQPKYVKTYPIPLPPLPEQQRIADRIESLFAKLDEAKEKAQEVVDGFEERKAAILHKAFTGELTAKWRAEHGVGMDSWEANELKDFLEPMENKKPKGDEFRYIDIDSIDNINQIVKEPKIIMVKDAPSRASRGLKTNDIVFSMVRPYLKNIAYIYEELSDCIASTGFYVCRCNKKLLPQFLFKFLCSKDAIDYLMKYMKGDNSPSIRQNDLLGMPVLFPKLLEQIEITKILNSILSQEQHAKKAAESVLDQIDLIKKSILAKAFRGELGTNNPDDESAVELLKACLQEQ